jgi:hypothetical protein
MNGTGDSLLLAYVRHSCLCPAWHKHD